MQVTKAKPTVESTSKTKKRPNKLVLGMAGFLAAAVIGTGAASAAQLSPTASQSGAGYGGGICNGNNALCIVINGGQNIINITLNFFFG